MAEETAPPLIEIEDLTVRRNRAVLLDRVSLEVARGTTHLMVGPNGAGKSTLIAALLGQIEFTGAVRMHWRGSGRIGFVPQTFAIDRSMPLTAGEFLALSRQRRPMCLAIGAALRARIGALLERTGLLALARRPLGDLSGGELQALLLANAIDPEPELLVLDEPAAALDEARTRRFEAILGDLQRQSGVTVLMVSHDAAQVRRLADHVTVLNVSVQQSGRVADVLPPLAGAPLPPGLTDAAPQRPARERP